MDGASRDMSGRTGPVEMTDGGSRSKRRSFNGRGSGCQLAGSALAGIR